MTCGACGIVIHRIGRPEEDLIGTLWADPSLEGPEALSCPRDDRGHAPAESEPADGPLFLAEPDDGTPIYAYAPVNGEWAEIGGTEGGIEISIEPGGTSDPINDGVLQFSFDAVMRRVNENLLHAFGIPADQLITREMIESCVISPDHPVPRSSLSRFVRDRIARWNQPSRDQYLQPAWNEIACVACDEHGPAPYDFSRREWMCQHDGCGKYITEEEIRRRRQPLPPDGSPYIAVLL